VAVHLTGQIRVLSLNPQGQSNEGNISYEYLQRLETAAAAATVSTTFNFFWIRPWLHVNKTFGEMFWCLILHVTSVNICKNVLEVVTCKIKRHVAGVLLFYYIVRHIS